MVDLTSRAEPLDPAQVRAALDRITASAPFASSPRLVSFLRFVVLTTLEGGGDRLKGYTIGVEALGRSAEFDPQLDPIVRVEAGRLRRALARYYAEEGQHDPVLIELSSGSYVPGFRHRSPPNGLQRLPSAARRMAGHPAFRRWRLAAFGGLAIIALCTSVHLVMATWWPVAPLRSTSVPAADDTVARSLPASPFPVLFVDAFDVDGIPPPAGTAVRRLRSKLRDALARFDELDVAAEFDSEPSGVTGSVRPPARSSYRLVASAEERGDDTMGLYFRLYDVRDGLIVWTRNFENLHVVNGAIVDENDLVRRLAPTLAQPYGVIYARELARAPGNTADVRYRCVIDAFEFYRWHGVDRQQRAHACAERLTAEYPTFAAGFIISAFLDLRDHYNGTGDATTLDRAMSAAQRAVSLDFESARAHQVMMNVLYSRGDFDASLSSGARAVAANPWDMIAQTSYGIRLLWNGDVDQAMKLLQQADEIGPAQPQFVAFALFVGAYMRGDDTLAARYASRMVSDAFAYGVAARAIAAVRTGDRERARRDIRKLLQLRPNWRTEAQSELLRYGVPANVATRMVNDLNAAGLNAGS